jgi:hypothetical protein
MKFISFIPFFIYNLFYLAKKFLRLFILTKLKYFYFFKQINIIFLFIHLIFIFLQYLKCLIYFKFQMKNFSLILNYHSILYQFLIFCLYSIFSLYLIFLHKYSQFLKLNLQHQIFFVY